MATLLGETLLYFTSFIQNCTIFDFLPGFINEKLHCSFQLSTSESIATNYSDQ